MNADHTAPAAEAVATPAHRFLHDVEGYVRREPAKAAAAAFGAGLLLNVLPTRLIVGTIAAVTVPFMRPALLALGLIKAAELCCGESNSGASTAGAHED